MRPVLLLIAIGFGVMLVGIPALMLAVGLGAGAAIGLGVLILVVAVFLLAVIRYMSAAYEVDQEGLLAGEVVASWRLSPDEHRRFLASERRSTQRLAAAYAFGGLALGAVFAIVGDRLLGLIMAVAFLIAATVILTLSGPPRSAGTDAGRDVLIGRRGVRVLDRYLPFHGTLTRLRGLELQPGDPAILAFRVRSGRRIVDVRVPFTLTSLPEAESLVEGVRQRRDS